jgi:hypothetical protein
MIGQQTGDSLGSALTLVNEKSWNSSRLVSNAELPTKVRQTGFGEVSDCVPGGLSGIQKLSSPRSRRSLGRVVGLPDKCL